MIYIDRSELEEIMVDLEGIVDLLMVVEESRYYEKQDANVFHAIKNSVQYSKKKLELLTKRCDKKQRI